MDNMNLMAVSSDFDGHNEDLPYLLRHLSRAIKERCEDRYIATVQVTRHIDSDIVSYEGIVCYESARASEGGKDE